MLSIIIRKIGKSGNFGTLQACTGLTTKKTRSFNRGFSVDSMDSMAIVAMPLSRDKPRLHRQTTQAGFMPGLQIKSFFAVMPVHHGVFQQIPEADVNFTP